MCDLAGRAVFYARALSHTEETQARPFLVGKGPRAYAAPADLPQRLPAQLLILTLDDRRCRMIPGRSLHLIAGVVLVALAVALVSVGMKAHGGPWAALIGGLGLVAGIAAGWFLALGWKD